MLSPLKFYQAYKLLRTLREDLQGLIRDAKRYRFVRTQGQVEGISPEQFDAAVDLVISAEAKH